jgi:hypothetical protein
VSSSKILNYGVDLYRLRVNPGGVIDINVTGGEFRIDGDLIVTGNLTALDTTNTNILDNIITLNSGESGAGVSAGTAGIEIDRGSEPKARILFDESKTSLDSNGAFTFTNENGSLLGIYTNSVYTIGDQNLYLLGPDSTGIVSVNYAIDYERQVFPYDNQGKITESGLSIPIDPDALVNAQALIDYMNSYFQYNLVAGLDVFQIKATDDPNTKVIAEADLEKQVRVLINNVEVAKFTEEQTELVTVLISDKITTPVDTDLILEPGANVSVSDKRIVNLADPIDDTDAVNKQYLNQTLENQLGILLGIDTTNLPSGSMLVYDADLGKFVAETVLNNQIIDAGTY